MTEEVPTSETARRASAAMQSARTAFDGWSGIDPTERSACIERMRRKIVLDRDEIVRTICAEAGKTRAEALSSDVLPTLEMLRYLERETARILEPRKAKTPLVFGRASSRVEYRPRGVVVVIAPWNNPFQLSLVPAAFALAAGNTVVLKPSPLARKTAALVGRLCQDAGLAQDALQVEDGGAETALALIAEQPDLVFFTGGPAGGRAVLEAAARHLIPVILELGGKDPMIVLADADLERVEQAAVYGAFTHAGQHCVSTKRLLVEKPIYGTLLDRIANLTRSLTETGEWGRVVDERAMAAAAEQVREAVADGARLVVPDDLDRAGAEPTLVSDCSPSMRLVQEETFAPVLAVLPFETDAEAVEMANDSPFGLNASVWSGDAARADDVVGRLRTGNACVNNVLINIGNPHLPFGGVKASGFGRYHGPEGLRAFCVETSVLASRSRRRTEPNWFPHDDNMAEMTDELIELRYGEMSRWQRLTGWIRVGRKLTRRGKNL